MIEDKKRCYKCDTIKSITEFYRDKNNNDGYRYDCKDCSKAYERSPKGKEVRKQYKKSEKGKKSNSKYGKSEKGKATSRRYAKSEKGRTTQRRHRRTEKSNARMDRFFSSPKGKHSRSKSNVTRRTNRSDAGGSFTHNQWYRLCEYYDFHCLRCNRKFPFEELTFDHIRPVSRSGSSDISNGQPLCKSCNSKKGTKEIDYRKTLPDWINRDGLVWQQDTLF
jgi:5-methylcytosine-specific restriction endonuclease McrA